MHYNQQQYGQNIHNSGNQYTKPFDPMNPMQPMQPTQPVQVAKIAEPEKPKAPIPEQHVHLKTIFDELRTQCYESAKNPVKN